MQIRYFHCPVCHTKVVAPKTKNYKKIKQKGKMNRKHMWCYVCQKEQRFILDEITEI